MRDYVNFLNSYINMLKYQKRYSEYTLINYEKDILEFFNYLDLKNINYKLIGYDEIQKFLLDLYNKNYKKTSINRKISSIKGFYKYLCEENVLKNNNFENISSLKKEKKLPNYLYTNEMEKLLELGESDNAINQRNELIIELLYATGLRVSELVSINLANINFNSKTIKIIGKGSKERVVLFGDYAALKLDKYLNDGRKVLLCDKQNQALLLNARGGRLTDRSIRNIINLMTSKAKIQTRVTPHTIRHTYATHMLNEGADLTTVKEQLGHKNLSTTSIYTHLSKEHLRNTYLNSHPRAKK